MALCACPQVPGMPARVPPRTAALMAAAQAPHAADCTCGGLAGRAGAWGCPGCRLSCRSRERSYASRTARPHTDDDSAARSRLSSHGQHDDGRALFMDKADAHHTACRPLCLSRPCCRPSGGSLGSSDDAVCGIVAWGLQDLGGVRASRGPAPPPPAGAAPCRAPGPSTPLHSPWSCRLRLRTTPLRIEPARHGCAVLDEAVICRTKHFPFAP